MNAIATLNPGIDHIQTIAGQVEFDHLNRTHMVTLCPTDKRQLLELYLTLGGLNSWPNIGLPMRQSAPRVLFPNRVTVDISVRTDRGSSTQDVTPFYIAALREQLTPADNYSGAYNMYKNACLRYHQRLKALLVQNGDLDSQPLDSAITEIDSLGEESFKKMVISLGDQSMGYFGSTHPFNYTGTEIPINPIPISSALTADMREQMGSSKAVDLRISVDDSTLFVGGRVCYTLFGVYYNRLFPEFKDLETSIRRVLLDIRRKVGTGSQLLEFASKAQDGVMDAMQLIEKCSTQVESNRLRVEALKNEILQLRNLVALYVQDRAKKSGAS